eukprot:10108-Pelagococcus_subviridis.AAC.2
MDATLDSIIARNVSSFRASSNFAEHNGQHDVEPAAAENDWNTFARFFKTVRSSSAFDSAASLSFTAVAYASSREEADARSPFPVAGVAGAGRTSPSASAFSSASFASRASRRSFAAAVSSAHAAALAAFDAADAVSRAVSTASARASTTRLSSIFTFSGAGTRASPSKTSAKRSLVDANSDRMDSSLENNSSRFSRVFSADSPAAAARSCSARRRLRVFSAASIASFFCETAEAGGGGGGERVGRSAKRLAGRRRRALEKRTTRERRRARGKRSRSRLFELHRDARRRVRVSPLVEQLFRVVDASSQVLNRVVGHRERGHLSRGVVSSAPARAPSLLARLGRLPRGGELPGDLVHLARGSVVLRAVLRAQLVRGAREPIEEVARPRAHGGVRGDRLRGVAELARARARGGGGGERRRRRPDIVRVRGDERGELRVVQAHETRVSVSRKGGTRAIDRATRLRRARAETLSVRLRLRGELAVRAQIALALLAEFSRARGERRALRVVAFELGAELGGFRAERVAVRLQVFERVRQLVLQARAAARALRDDDVALRLEQRLLLRDLPNQAQVVVSRFQRLVRAVNLFLQRSHAFAQSRRLSRVLVQSLLQLRRVVALHAQRFYLELVLLDRRALLLAQLVDVLQRFRVFRGAENFVKLLLQRRRLSQRPVAVLLMHEHDVL